MAEYEDWKERVGESISMTHCNLYSGFECPNDTYDCGKCFEIFMKRYDEKILHNFAEDLKSKLRKNNIFETITNAEDKNVFEIIDETIKEMGCE